MQFKGYTSNILTKINQPAKLRKALYLLCHRSNMYLFDVAKEMGNVRQATPSNWGSGVIRIGQSTAMGICAVFNITISDLVNLMENPLYIDEIAPRKWDIDQRLTKPKRYFIHAIKNNQLIYIRKTPEGGYNLDTYRHTKAEIFADLEAHQFIKLAPKKFLLELQLLVEKRVASFE